MKETTSMHAEKGLLLGFGAAVAAAAVLLLWIFQATAAFSNEMPLHNTTRLPITTGYEDGIQVLSARCRKKRHRAFFLKAPIPGWRSMRGRS